MGLKKHDNSFIPIWEMQVGSWALVTLRHFFAHFDRIRIVLGSIMVNPEWRWFLKRTILHLEIWNHIWIPIWELYIWSWLREKMCSSWAPFSQLRVILGPSLTSLERRLFGRNGIIGLKIQKKKIHMHLRDSSGFSSTCNVEAFFCLFWSYSYHFWIDYG